jgi:hypothetical protein
MALMRARAGISSRQAGRNLMAFLDAFKAAAGLEGASARHSKERGD